MVEPLMITDLSQLPGELLNMITQKLDNCFDVVHVRSVCSSWRSAFPFPACLLRPNYEFPAFDEVFSKCIVEKVPLFLFRVQTPVASTYEYFLGGIGRDESGDHMNLQSPVQCSVNVEIPGYHPTVKNMLDFQILPLGHQYRMFCWDPQGSKIIYEEAVAFLPLNKESEGEEFVVLIRDGYDLLALKSTEMKWVRLNKTSDALFVDLVTFRGRFYAVFNNDDIFVIDPYSLIPTPLMPLPPLKSRKYLVPSGDDDELFLVENFYPLPGAFVIDLNRFVCRVSRLDAETDKWVVVTDLGNLVLFIGHSGNVCCSANKLPDGCGVSGNSIVFTNELQNVYAYKYGVHTGLDEDNLNCWKISKENHVTILSKSPVLSLRAKNMRGNIV